MHHRETAGILLEVCQGVATASRNPAEIHLEVDFIGFDQLEQVIIDPLAVDFLEFLGVVVVANLDLVELGVVGRLVNQVGGTLEGVERIAVRVRHRRNREPLVIHLGRVAQRAVPRATQRIETDVRRRRRQPVVVEQLLDGTRRPVVVPGEFDLLVPDRGDLRKRLLDTHGHLLADGVQLQADLVDMIAGKRGVGQRQHCCSRGATGCLHKRATVHDGLHVIA